MRYTSETSLIYIILYLKNTWLAPSHLSCPPSPPTNKQLAYPFRTNSAAASKRGSKTLHCALFICQNNLLAKGEAKKKKSLQGPTKDSFLMDQNQIFPNQCWAGTVPGNANRCGMKESVLQWSPGNNAYHSPFLETLTGHSTIKAPISYNTFFLAQPTEQWWAKHQLEKLWCECVSTYGQGPEDH